MNTSHKNRKTKKNRTQTNRKLESTLLSRNCSPIVNGKTEIPGSCFTAAALYQLKEYYNKHHPDSPILSKTPSQLWHDFRLRFFSCKREDCWLKEIDNIELRENLEKFLFAPPQPAEWKKKPNEWLSNFDIFEVLHQYELTYPNFKVFGPTPLDFDSRPKEDTGKCVWEELCKFQLNKYLERGITKLGVVFNLDKHDQGGSHWVSLFVDLDEQFLFYLDSAGNQIPKEIRNLVKRIQSQGLSLSTPLKLKFYENYPLEHQLGNTECGMYSLYFIITMLTGETEDKVLRSAKDKIQFFKRTRIPDKYVSKYRRIYFTA
jgi:Ulp1 protease family, C-terminal catalytic domain